MNEVKGNLGNIKERIVMVKLRKGKKSGKNVFASFLLLPLPSVTSLMHSIPPQVNDCFFLQLKLLRTHIYSTKRI